MVDKYNILVTGSDGQLGNSIRKISNEFVEYKIFFLNKILLDISNFDLIKKYVNDYKINVIVNCAAYTNVEKAEVERNIADIVNNLSVDNLAKICSERNIKLIHISTDYIFDGFKDSSYTEMDNPNPINYYGLSKLNGEKRIMSYDLNNSIIIRTSWLYSDSNNNFVSKIIDKINKKIDIEVVENEFGSPTNADDLAIAILTIIPKIRNSETELYHFSNIGICSRHEFANQINNIINGKSLIKSVKSPSYEVKRPKFSPLNSSKIIKKYDLKINDWKYSLNEHLKRILNNELLSNGI